MDYALYMVPDSITCRHKSAHITFKVAEMLGQVTIANDALTPECLLRTLYFRNHKKNKAMQELK